MRRQVSRFFSSLLKTGHSISQYYQVVSTPRLAEKLKTIDAMKIEIAERRASANGNLNEAIQNRLRYLWTYHSNAIEGNRLTLGDTIFFLQEGLTVAGKPFKDFLDTQNHAKAIDYLAEVVCDRRPIDCFLLSSMNTIILRGIDTIPATDPYGRSVEKKLISGSYKKEPNYVVRPDGTMHQYVEPIAVAEELTDLCEWVNDSKEHPIITASVAHFNMVRIHPFQDGNGRGARLLMNLILMKNGYNPAIIEVERRNEYLKSLQEADDGNLQPFTEFVAAAVEKTQLEILEEIKKYLSLSPSR